MEAGHLSGSGREREVDFVGDIAEDRPYLFLQRCQHGLVKKPVDLQPPLPRRPNMR